MPKLLITAGPTHEPIDAVRYIANRSSGRLGIELATAAAARTWPVTLLLGPTPLQPPDGSHINVQRFQTTADLQQLLRKTWPAHDVLIMAAAVADYRPKRSGFKKLQRGENPLTLELESTPDLLAELASTSRGDQVLIGFALEPVGRLIESAQNKLARKGVHAIVANPLETMDSPSIEASVIFRDGSVINAHHQSKADFAEWLLDRLNDVSRSAGIQRRFSQ